MIFKEQAEVYLKQHRGSEGTLTFRQVLAKAGLEEQAVSDIGGISSRVSLEDGDLFDPAENGVAFFYIQSGFVIETEILSNGSVFNTLVLGQGSILFNSTVFSGVNTSSSPKYRTFCDTELVLVHSNSFSKLAKNRPAVIEYAHKGFVEQAAMWREVCLLTFFIDKRTQIILGLLSIFFFSSNNYISIPMTKLAKMANISKRHIIYIVNELVDLGCLAKDHSGVCVSDMSGMLDLIPYSIIEGLLSLPKYEVFNLDGCFIGRFLSHIEESGWEPKPIDEN